MSARVVFAVLMGGLAIGFGCAVVDGIGVGGYDTQNQQNDAGGPPDSGTLGGGTCQSTSECPSGNFCVSGSCKTAGATINPPAFRTFSPALTYSLLVAQNDAGPMERIVMTDGDAGCATGLNVAQQANSINYIFELYQSQAAGPLPQGSYAFFSSSTTPTQNLAARAYGYYLDGTCNRYDLPAMEATGGSLSASGFDSTSGAVAASGTFSNVGAGSGLNASIVSPTCAPASPTPTTCDQQTGAMTGSATSSSGPFSFSPADAISQGGLEGPNAGAIEVIIGSHDNLCVSEIRSQSYENSFYLGIDVWTQQASGTNRPVGPGTYNIVSTTPYPLGNDAAAYVTSTNGTCGPGTVHAQAASGTVTITSINQTTNSYALNGSYSITFQGQSTPTTGTFTSAWCGWKIGAGITGTGGAAINGCSSGACCVP